MRQTGRIVIQKTRTRLKKEVTSLGLRRMSSYMVLKCNARLFIRRYIILMHCCMQVFSSDDTLATVANQAPSVAPSSNTERVFSATDAEPFPVMFPSALGITSVQTQNVNARVRLRHV